MNLLALTGLLLLTVTQAWGEIGFDEQYERDDHIFNPINQSRPDNPLNPINQYNPNMPNQPFKPLH